MYALWKTQGLTIEPWRADVRFGAVRDGRRLFINLTSDAPWQGRLIFDRPRHKEIMHLPLDYARINQFPEWFVVEANARCRVKLDPRAKFLTRSGQELRDGLPMELGAGEEKCLVVEIR